MCGIVGFITAESGYVGAQDRRSFMAQALVVDTLRGEDSTGIMYGFSTAKDAKCGYLKDATDGYQFVNSNEYVNVAKDMGKYRFMIGHNRAATMGAVSPATAHPFKEGPVVGLHNGTVRSGMTTLPVSMAQFEGEIDSHCLIHNLSVVQPEEAVDKVLSKIDGAYMLVWFDARDGSLNMARNSERAFHVAQALAEDTFYFASEALELEWLLSRNNIQHCGVESLNPGHLLKWTGKTLQPEITEYTVAPKYTPPTYHSQWSYDRAPYYAPYTPPKATPPAENRLLLGGQKRAVPMLHQAELLEWGLAVEDRLVVKPMAVQPVALRQNAGVGYCVAYSDTCALTFLVQGVPETTLKDRFTSPWTVRPIGVWRQSETEVLIISKLVAAYPTPEVMSLYDSSTGTDPGPTAGFGYAGPGGTSLTKYEWLEMTEAGCSICTQALVLADAPSLVWDDEDPVCPDCAAVPVADARFEDNIYDWLH